MSEFLQNYRSTKKKNIINVKEKQSGFNIILGIENIYKLCYILIEEGWIGKCMYIKVYIVYI